MTGAWGTLGAITEVTVRLRARPEVDRTLAIVAEGRADAFCSAAVALAARAARTRRSPPSCARRRWPRGSVSRGAALLLVRLGGNERVRPRRRAIGRRAGHDGRGRRRRLGASPHDRSRRVGRGATRHPALRARRVWSAASRVVERAGGWTHATLERGVVRCVVPAGDERRGTERIRGIIEQLHAPGSRVVERLPASLWDAIAAPPRRPSVVRRSPNVRSGRRAQPRDPGPALVNAPTRSATPCAIPDTPLANEIAGIDACVHCGFCLQACPTYLTPRGRERQSARTHRADARTGRRHAPGRRSRRTHAHRSVPRLPRVRDGVPVGRAVRTSARGDARHADDEAAESRRSRARSCSRSRGPRCSRSRCSADASRARFASRRCCRALPGRFGFAMAMLEATRAPLRRAGYTPRGRRQPRHRDAAHGLRDGRAVHRDQPRDGTDARRERLRDGARRAGQRCCGALHAHAGDLETARRSRDATSRRSRRSGADYIVVNAAGCGAMMKEYEHLLERDPEWRDRAGDVLGDGSRRERAARARRARVRARAVERTVTYDAPCHLLHAQRIASPPLRVLGAVPGLDARSARG